MEICALWLGSIFSSFFFTDTNFSVMLLFYVADNFRLVFFFFFSGVQHFVVTDTVQVFGITILVCCCKRTDCCGAIALTKTPFFAMQQHNTPSQTSGLFGGQKQAKQIKEMCHLNSLGSLLVLVIHFSMRRPNAMAKSCCLWILLDILV